MRKGRFSEEQMVAIIREADRDSVAAVAKRTASASRGCGTPVTNDPEGAPKIKEFKKYDYIAKQFTPYFFWRAFRKDGKPTRAKRGLGERGRALNQRRTQLGLCHRQYIPGLSNHLPKGPVSQVFDLMVEPRGVEPLTS